MRGRKRIPASEQAGSYFVLRHLPFNDLTNDKTSFGSCIPKGSLLQRVRDRDVVGKRMWGFQSSFERNVPCAQVAIEQ